ncbi:MAG: hypothetical protein KGD59_12075 [Candidatus Heimdallarchaeota archaeon]|nr:hypothetical protein [Candidatus Heimdallarchaeota archaeon]MBY8995281.1 hypothetical protein [Candidatus Heimdallarchaeota archaeon]
MSQLPKEDLIPKKIEDPDEFIEQISDSEIPQEEYDSKDVKLNWSRVIIVATVIALFITGLTLFVFWIISRNAGTYVYLFVSWAYFIETGLLLTFGGCVGTVRQSFTIDRIKKRFSKGDKITGADTKIAIGSAYTYILSGVLLGIVSVIAWVILKRITL